MSDAVKLTMYAKTSGCAAKIGPAVLSEILGKLPAFSDPDLLVGFGTSDDAAVYRVSEELAVIQTLDFFPPVADDPYTFGQIAAANALSDVYAMGGEPKLALNIVGFPAELDPGILEKILQGGADKVKEAGAVLVGGHSIQTDAPLYGLSVTGFVHPDRIWTNAGARPGDALILTKPIGSGLVNTAVKADLASEKSIREAVLGMRSLNRTACEVLRRFEVHAATDVTGFGLICHGKEMADASGVTLVIESRRVPYLPEAAEYARMGLVPGGSYRNREYVQGMVREEGLSEEMRDLLYDPQTSGGLLVSVPQGQVTDIMLALREAGLPTRAAVIGHAASRTGFAVIVQ